VNDEDEILLGKLTYIINRPELITALAHTRLNYIAFGDIDNARKMEEVADLIKSVRD